MLLRSSAFDAQIIAGCTSTTTAVMRRSGSTLASLKLLPGAKVSLDETAAARRTFSGQVADDGTLAPHVGSDPLAPFGIELTLTTGVVLPDGSAELVPAGIFRVDVTQADSTGIIELSGPDRSAVVANARNESAYTVPANTPLDVAIGQYLAAKYPSLPFQADSNSHSVMTPSTPTIYGEGTTNGDPWQNMRDMATAAGRELYINASGSAVLRPVPDPSTTPAVWEYKPGPTNLAAQATHIMDTSPSANVYNVAIATGEGTGVDPPVRASSEVTDPTSAIYPATFGRRPVWFSSSFITTTAQAQNAADALLLRKMGASENTTFTAVPHPAHEPGDVVHYVSTVMGIDTYVVLSAWTLQLDLLAAATYKTRRSAA